jgi:hypothetical protein
MGSPFSCFIGPRPRNLCWFFPPAYIFLSPQKLLLVGCAFTPPRRESKVGSLMMMGPILDNFEYPHWLKLYQKALVELDRGTLRVRVAAAEAACFSRLQVMSSAGETSSERRAIEEALGSLRLLSRETLGPCDSNDSLDQVSRPDFVSTPDPSCGPASGSTATSPRNRQPVRRLVQWAIYMCSLCVSRTALRFCLRAR